MPEVYETAIVQGRIDLGENVLIGPGCRIDGTLGPVRIGPGTRLLGDVWVYGPTTIGADNTIYPFCCLRFAPQSWEYASSKTGCGLTIGDHNVLCEHVTLHRASTNQGPTTVGDHNYFMSDTHAGHDCRIGNHCTIAQAAVVGGHVALDDHATVGGAAAIHQFSRIGRGAMVGGALPVPRDVPPFFLLTHNDVIGSVNVVGMRRLEIAEDVIQDIRWVYKTLYRRRFPISKALEEIKTRSDRPIVAEYVEFIESSKRGICAGPGRGRRGG
jgi:UDP-N-acetylglucosamine acyltransferase